MRPGGSTWAPAPRRQALGGEEPRARGHLPLHRDEADSHTTEAVYRLYAIVAESDLRDAGTKLAAMSGTTTEPARLSDSSGTISVAAPKTHLRSG